MRNDRDDIKCILHVQGEDGVHSQAEDRASQGNLRSWRAGTGGLVALSSHLLIYPQYPCPGPAVLVSWVTLWPSVTHL